MGRASCPPGWRGSGAGETLANVVWVRSHAGWLRALVVVIAVAVGAVEGADLRVGERSTLFSLAGHRIAHSCALPRAAEWAPCGTRGAVRVVSCSAAFDGRPARCTRFDALPTRWDGKP